VTLEVLAGAKGTASSISRLLDQTGSRNPFVTRRDRTNPQIRKAARSVWDVRVRHARRPVSDSGFAASKVPAGHRNTANP
jgi:hypothetical protein